MDIKELYKLYLEHPTITTDSRNCPKDSIFLALKGASFDGNKFAQAALDKGCAYAIVSSLTDPEAQQGDTRYIVVDDTLQTYKDLAREHRRHFQLPIIGITGTNGKTTTKELVKAVLSECYRVMATEGNYNNDVGVPKTLFRLSDDDDIAVVEMGASHPGDIKTLVETAEPTCGLITNVGRAHLQGFDSFEGVCRTKGELYDFLRSHELPVFVNRDNEHLMAMTDGLADIYYYGQSDNKDILIRGEVISCAPFLKFRWREQDHDANYVSDWMEVETQLIGAYNLDNILAAITVGYVNNVPFDRINHAIANYTPHNNRSQMTITEKNHLVVDAYNANPSSMQAAIDNFQLMDVPAKMLILGDMRELGDVSAEEHQKVVDRLQQAGFNEVWLVGEEFMKTQCSFRKFHDVEEVKAAISEQKPSGKYILIKGSNGIKLFQLPELL